MMFHRIVVFMFEAENNLLSLFVNERMRGYTCHLFP